MRSEPLQGRPGTRHLVLALLLVPLLGFGLLAWRNHSATVRVLPPFEVADVGRIELSHADETLLLVRTGADGGWEIRSAADAPGDGARIGAALKQLAALRGKPLAADAPAASRPPVEVKLLDQAGRELVHAGIWPTEARALPDGPRRAIARPPALPLWPSAWSSLRPPQIDAAKVARVERLTRDGLVPLDDADAARVAALLAGLSASGFVPGSDVDWRGATMVRATLIDGTAIDLAQVPDGKGQFFLRLASDTDAGVRAARRFAFLVSKPLP